MFTVKRHKSRKDINKNRNTFILFVMMPNNVVLARALDGS